jgi:hypothetical protein
LVSRASCKFLSYRKWPRLFQKQIFASPKPVSQSEAGSGTAALSTVTSTWKSPLPSRSDEVSLAPPVTLKSPPKRAGYRRRIDHDSQGVDIVKAVARFQHHRLVIEKENKEFEIIDGQGKSADGTPAIEKQCSRSVVREIDAEIDRTSWGDRAVLNKRNADQISVRERSEQDQTQHRERAKGCSGAKLLPTEVSVAKLK